MATTTTTGRELPRGIILDQTGTPVPSLGPIPQTRLSIGGGTPDRYRSYFTRNLTPGILAAAIDEADSGYPDALVQIQEDMLAKDPRLRSAFQVRALAVMCTPWTILPTDENDLRAQEIADFVWTEFERTGARQLFANQLEAVSKPLAVSWITWGMRDGYVVPIKYTRVSQRSFVWDTETDELQIFSGQYGDKPVPIPANETVRSVYLDLGGPPWRGGLMRSLDWFSLFKHSNMRHWIHYTEKYGMPMRKATMPPEDFLDPVLVAAVKSQLTAVGADLSAVIPQGSELEVDAIAVGDPVYKVLCDYIDVAEARLILGHELSSSSSPGPGQLGVSAAKDVRQEIRQSDCEMLSEDIRRDVFRPMTVWNFGEDAAELTPTLKFDYEEPIDLQQAAQTRVTIAKYFPDLAHSITQIRDTYSFDPPADADFEEETDAIYAKTPVSPDVKSPRDPDEEKPDDEDENGEEDPDEIGEDTNPIRAVNSASAGVKRRRLPPSERNVQAIIADGEAKARAELLALRKPIAEVIKRAGAERWNEAMTIRALTQLYRKLDLSKTERLHREKTVTARLYGRNSAAKGRR